MSDGVDHLKPVDPAYLVKHDTTCAIENQYRGHAPHPKALCQFAALRGIDGYPHNSRPASDLSFDPVNDGLGQQASASKVGIKAYDCGLALSY